MSTNKKRKASTAASLGDEVTIRKSDNAETIAEALLSLVPNSATVSHKDAKKLNRAFNLFQAQLQHRSRVLAQNATESGAKEPLLISNVAVPEEIFLKVFQFLPQTALGCTVPLVSKAWLAAARVPKVWETVTIRNGYGTNNKLSMTDVLAILQQRHLSQVKHFTVPGKIKFGKSGLKKLAAACPMLETLDLKKMNPDNSQLLQCLEHFPHLAGLSFTLWKVTGSGVAEFAKAAGPRLQSLHVEGSAITHSYLHDRNFSTIAEHCPNLRDFGYHIWPEKYRDYVEYRDGGTHAGMIALVQGCTFLKTLTIDWMPKLGLEFFQYLLASNDEEHHHLQTLHTRHIECVGGPEGQALAELLAVKIPNLSLRED